MTNATQPLAKRIAIVFDFDDTLVPNTYNLLLEDLGLTPIAISKNATRFARQPDGMAFRPVSLA
jgi:phosphoserine phosphatase